MTSRAGNACLSILSLTAASIRLDESGRHRGPRLIFDWEQPTEPTQIYGKAEGRPRQQRGNKRTWRQRKRRTAAEEKHATTQDNRDPAKRPQEHHKARRATDPRRAQQTPGAPEAPTRTPAPPPALHNAEQRDRRARTVKVGGATGTGERGEGREGPRRKGRERTEEGGAAGRGRGKGGGGRATRSRRTKGREAEERWRTCTKKWAPRLCERSRQRPRDGRAGRGEAEQSRAHRQEWGERVGGRAHEDGSGQRWEAQARVTGRGREWGVEGTTHGQLHSDTSNGGRGDSNWGGARQQAPSKGTPVAAIRRSVVSTPEGGSTLVGSTKERNGTAVPESGRIRVRRCE